MMTNRRDFLKSSTLALLAANAAAAADWKKQVGLQLYTVRDLFDKDPEGTLAKVAEIGIKEVEPTSFGNLQAKEFRALLDRYGLRAPSTHVAAAAGPNFEKDLEDRRIIGMQYTAVRGEAGAGRASAAPGASPQRRGPTVESVKRSSAQMNEYGKVARKFGIKILIHNHTQEFELLDDGKTTEFDIQLAETDPSLVTLQLDIGWASVAGQNIVEMFRKHSGRFELWHVKDATGIRGADPKATPNARRQAAKLTPVGEGDVDYKTIFANAQLAGLKHFYIEQDNAAQNGDSMAAAKTSYQNLLKVL